LLSASDARRLAALEPELVCFGHGPPLRDPRQSEVPEHEHGEEREGRVVDDGARGVT